MTRQRRERALAPAFDVAVRRLPERWAAALERPTLAFMLHAAALLIVFVVVDRLVERISALPAASYAEPTLIVELANRLGTPLLTAFGIALVALGLLGALFSPWHELEHGCVLRNFTVALATLIAWPFVTMGYNHFFDQAHLLDRALLVALVPLIAWRPVFLLAFLPLVYAVMGQLVEPALGGTILEHKLQVLRALNLVAAAILVHGLTGLRSTGPLVYLLACVVAAAYWLPALAKLRLGWLASDELHYMPLVAYAHGWLNVLSPAEIVDYARRLIPFDAALRVAVIVAEAGCLVFLWRRRLSLVLLLAVMLFHLGIFALYGFLFWTWMALDAALFMLLMRRTRWPEIHGGVVFVASIGLILACNWWAQPPPLGWYDTPLAYAYRIDARTEDGDLVTLHPRFFAPYEDTFTMASFSYASDSHAVLVGPYGVTQDKRLVDALAAVRTADGIFAMESMTPIRHDPDRAQRLYDFLVRFVAKRNANGDLLRTLHASHPPRQFLSHAPGLYFLDGLTLRELIVTEVTTFYDGESLAVIRELELMRLPIPAAAKPP